MEFCRSGLIVVQAHGGLSCCFVVREILFTLEFSSDTNRSSRQMNHISWCMLIYTPMTSRNHACTRKLIAMRLRVSIISPSRVPLLSDTAVSAWYTDWYSARRIITAQTTTATAVQAPSTVLEKYRTRLRKYNNYSLSYKNTNSVAVWVTWGCGPGHHRSLVSLFAIIIR